jgi:hypothetical protein
MKFETKPLLILTKDEFNILDNALRLCRDMDLATQTEENEDGFTVSGCNICPFKEKCSLVYDECQYAIAHRALKKIIDVAIVK